MRHTLLLLLALVAGATGGHTTEAAPREGRPPPSATASVAVEGEVVSFRRKAQHMYLSGNAGVSFDVARVRILHPAALAGGVMNITSAEGDRSFWETAVRQPVAFRMRSEDFVRLTEVLADDRQINGFPSGLLEGVQLKSPPSPFVPSRRAPGTLPADIHLRGVLQDEDGYHVALWNSPHKAAPEWVAIGGTFRGYTVQGYDAARETVRLQRGATVMEARLSGAPAILAPRRSSASTVVTEEGRRLCGLHRAVLVEAKGFVASSQVACEYTGPGFLIAYLKYRAEFPNSFGLSFSKAPSADRNVEVTREFCPACETAFTDRLAAIEGRKPSN